MIFAEIRRANERLRLARNSQNPISQLYRRPKRCNTCCITLGALLCNTCYSEGFISKSDDWLMLLAQLPASPSSARVALWRRLRAAGAASVLHGAWVLPKSTKHQELFTQLAETVRENGGNATVLTARNLDAGERNSILAQFRADRAAEYQEFDERAQGFLAEIDRETRCGKFTFAEFEECEDDLNKLSVWLEKIRARDFFPDEQAQNAVRTLTKCQEALRIFADTVYRKEGLGSSPED